MKYSDFRRAATNGSAMGAALSLLRKVGIDLQPYYVYREHAATLEPHRESAFEDYQPGFVDPEEMTEVARCDGSQPDRFVPRLNNGHRCFGIKKGVWQAYVLQLLRSVQSTGCPLQEKDRSPAP